MLVPLTICTVALVALVDALRHLRVLAGRRPSARSSLFVDAPAECVKVAPAV